MLVALVITILLDYGIFMTGSRKALIASAIITILWYSFCCLPQLFRKKSQWRMLILIVSVLLFVGAIFVFLRIYSGSDMASRMDDLERETTTGSRSSMYKFGWTLFLRQPLFGLGFQGFKYYHGLYSHATLVEVPVSGGICGIILYFASYFFSIKKCLLVYSYCKKNEELSEELAQIKMLIVLWAAMLFYCTCIIHPYQFDSYILFGIIFGQSSYLQKNMERIKTNDKAIQEKKCKWIK